MYCPNCGKELPDDAGFCIKCGKQLQGAAKSSAQAEPQWEYCTIASERQTGDGHLLAKVIGPKGTYTAAVSQGKTSQFSSHAKREAVLNEFINSLVAAGWEPLPPGGYGSGHRFRRNVVGQTKSTSNPSGTLAASTFKPVESTTRLQPQIESTLQRSSQETQHGCVYYTIAYLALGFGLFCVGTVIYYFFVPVGVPDPITHITMHSADEKFSNNMPGLILGVICLAIAFFMLRKAVRTILSKWQSQSLFDDDYFGSH